MSCKPYHAGHHYLITKAAEANDYVLVYASTSDRVRSGEFPISGEACHLIWKQEIMKILPGNVEVIFGGSPVRKVYERIGTNIENENFSEQFFIYSDVVDTKRNYSIENREKYMKPLLSRGLVRFPAEEDAENFIRGAGAPDISATEVRKSLQQHDFTKFSSYMPKGLNNYRIWKELNAAV